MTDYRDKALEVGALCRSPTGRLCRITRLHPHRGEADVEVLAHAMTLRTTHLRPVAPVGGDAADDPEADGAALY